MLPLHSAADESESQLLNLDGLETVPPPCEDGSSDVSGRVKSCGHTASTGSTQHHSTSQQARSDSNDTSHSKLANSASYDTVIVKNIVIAIVELAKSLDYTAPTHASARTGGGRGCTMTDDEGTALTRMQSDVVYELTRCMGALTSRLSSEHLKRLLGPVLHSEYPSLHGLWTSQHQHRHNELRRCDDHIAPDYE